MKPKVIFFLSVLPFFFLTQIAFITFWDENLLVDIKVHAMTGEFISDVEV